jgi:aryl-alcohol dehydrogenase-like predicted oxidoreductase
MEQRPLGTSDYHVAAIGLGAWPIGGGMGAVEEAEAIRIVHAAIDHGLTLIDTAQGYRTSESIIGRALAGGKRQQVFLATKVTGDYSPAAMRTALENSLRALNTDVIDLYQIHHWLPQYPIETTMELLHEFQKSGKVRAIGVSNFTVEQMQQAWATTPFQANQLAYHLFDRTIEQAEIPYCEQHGVGILAHSALAKGLLAGKYRPDTVFASDDERSGFPQFQGEAFARSLATADQLQQIAAEKGLTLVQFAIAWLLRLPVISSVLVGAKTPEHVADYVGALGVQWSEDELSRVDSILL